MNYKQRLEEYVEKDMLYQKFKLNVFPDSDLKGLSDFDKFCIQHCEDIDKLLNENEKLQEDLEYWQEKYKELEDSLNNDYDPEIEIPQIHKEGVSW